MILEQLICDYICVYDEMCVCGFYDFKELSTSKKGIVYQVINL